MCWVLVLEEEEDEIWVVGRACACLLAAIDAAVRWTTANGAWACDDADAAGAGAIPLNAKHRSHQ